MEHSFWHGCWENNKIAFHQLKPHKLLLQYFSANKLINGTRVFVPLCGKSLDMLWFMGNGAYVIGCELSEIAVKQFFIENKLSYQTKNLDDFVIYYNELCEIYCGDIFKLSKNIVGLVDLVYDRGALIALPPTMRKEYVSQITSLLRNKAIILLIAINYSVINDFNGPPFSIDDTMVAELYSSKYNIVKQIESNESSEENSRMYVAGIDNFVESLYQITLIE